MGFHTSLKGLCANISKSRPELTEAQVRAEAERYLNGPQRPMFSIEEIYDAFNESEMRREGVVPGLPHYSADERKARRERAAAIRKGMYTYIQYQNGYLDEFKYRLSEGGRDPRDPKLTEPERQEILKNARSYLDRAEQHLFYYVPPTAAPEEKARLDAENREIAFLFDTNEAHWEQYYNDNIARLKSSGDQRSDAELRAELEDDIKTRRGQALMRRAHIAGEMMDHAEAMSDPSLPAEQLANNYLLLMQEETIAMESLKCFVGNADSGRYKISPEDREYLLYLDRNQVRFATAADRIAAYGNPLTEFFDPGDLAGYDGDRVDDYYMNERGTQERGQPYYAALNRKHTHYNQYVSGKTIDQFSSITNDSESLYGGVDIVFRENYQGILERNGFTLGEGGAKITCEHFDKDGNLTVKENAGVEELKSGRPLVVEQDGHVAVLSQRYPTSTELVWDKPEKLFNYSLSYQNDKLTKQLKDADKWYQTRSDVFSEMRKSFEDIAKLTKNGLTDDAQQRAALAEKYADLLAKTDAYLDKKKRENVGEGHNPLEQGHIRVARELKKYAEQRVGELDTVQKARKGLTRFAGMSAQEIQKAARRDAYNAQQRVDRADMPKWLKEKCASYGNGNFGDLWKVTNVRVSFLSNLLNINRDYQKPGENYIYTCNQGSQSPALLMVGGMVAMEMIKNEREQRRAAGQNGPGSFEWYMGTENYIDAMRELGEAAVKYTVGTELEEGGLMTNEQFTEFLTRFHPEEMAAEMPETGSLLQRVETQQREAADAPLREAKEALGKVGRGVYTFANEKIAPPLDELRSKLAGGQKTCEMGAAIELLSNCVILGMAQLEELSGGNRLKRMLQDPAAVEVLRTEVTMSGSFAAILKDIAKPGMNGASIEGISKVLSAKKPQQMAKQVFESAAFNADVDRDMKARNITIREAGKGSFKLGDKPPAMGPKK